jgi:predicted  nucleic acid-binding Zn-ribbon protein
MQIAKQTKSEVIDKSLETDIETNVDELKRTRTAICEIENNSSAEMAAKNLATLLGRVSDVSTREIDNLIGELRILHEKLEGDRDRIQGAVAEYTQLSQGVMRLTANISKSVESLPNAPGIVPSLHRDDEAATAIV